ncbi:MAG: glucokinase [Spirochaetia bacterium]|nr:glucokinase [Spirochaetia bacterium]
MKIETGDAGILCKKYYLVSDIGGTNTTIALVGWQNDQFHIIVKAVFETQQITDFMIPFRQAFAYFTENFQYKIPESCCICAAGPIDGNVCHLTNASWGVDGNKITAEFGLKTFVINDFTALSYGIPVLNIDNEAEIVKMKDARGMTPVPEGPYKAVIGAGTGLGVGFTATVNGKTIAFPSEGGHFDFPAFDDETTELMIFTRKRLGSHPDMECFVSGIGLSYIFDFLTEEKHPEPTPLRREIKALPDSGRPPVIAANAMKDPVCAAAHRLFRKIYGKMAGNIASVLLPKGGLYIAGGVISKDLKLFLSDTTFIDAFSVNYKNNISNLLKTIPIYIVRNYSTSLLGAANAARNFEK